MNWKHWHRACLFPRNPPSLFAGSLSRGAPLPHTHTHPSIRRSLASCLSVSSVACTKKHIFTTNSNLLWVFLFSPSSQVVCVSVWCLFEFDRSPFVWLINGLSGVGGRGKVTVRFFKEKNPTLLDVSFRFGWVNATSWLEMNEMLADDPAGWFHRSVMSFRMDQRIHWKRDKVFKSEREMYVCGYLNDRRPFQFEFESFFRIAGCLVDQD